MFGDPLASATYAGVALAVVLGAQLVFLLLGRLEGYSVAGEIVQNNNAAVGIRNALFLGAVVLTFQGIARAPSPALHETALSLLAWAAVAVVLLAASRYVNDLLILYAFDNNREVVGAGNVAVAIVEGCTYLATAAIAAGASGYGEASLLTMLVWFAIGQALLVLLAQVYRRIMPDVDAALDEGNGAAALSMGGLLLACGMAVGGAVSGPSVGWPDDALATAEFLLGWAAFIAVAAYLARRVMMPQADLRAEVIAQRNVAAGVIQGTVFVVFTLIYVAMAAG